MTAPANKLELSLADITALTVDAIVNAANNELRRGHGVCGAIHSAGGEEILRECEEIGYCETGMACVTGAGRLPAKYVIHAVGPEWRGGEKDEPRLLASCYRESLALAARLGCKSVAFPAISAGIYGYPVEQAATIAVGATKEALEHHPSIERVLFVFVDQRLLDIYTRASHIA